MFQQFSVPQHSQVGGGSFFNTNVCVSRVCSILCLVNTRRSAGLLLSNHFCISCLISISFVFLIEYHWVSHRRRIATFVARGASSAGIGVSTAGCYRTSLANRSLFVVVGNAGMSRDPTETNIFVSYHVFFNLLIPRVLWIFCLQGLRATRRIRQNYWYWGLKPPSWSQTPLQRRRCFLLVDWKFR